MPSGRTVALIVAAAVTLTAAGGAAVYLTAGQGDPEPGEPTPTEVPSESDSPDAEPTAAPDPEPLPPVEVPDTLDPESRPQDRYPDGVESTRVELEDDECNNAAKPVRALMELWPSAMMLDAEATEQLNAGVADMREVCDDEVWQQFNDRELMGWLVKTPSAE